MAQVCVRRLGGALGVFECSSHKFSGVKFVADGFPVCHGFECRHALIEFALKLAGQYLHVSEAPVLVLNDLA